MIEDWQAADVPPKLRAGLALVAVITRDATTAEDLATARAAGLSDAAILDVAYVVSLFSTIVRLADALDWAIPPDFDSSRTALVKYGYRLPPLM